MRLRPKLSCSKAASFCGGPCAPKKLPNASFTSGSCFSTSTSRACFSSSLTMFSASMASITMIFCWYSDTSSWCLDEGSSSSCELGCCCCAPWKKSPLNPPLSPSSPPSPSSASSSSSPASSSPASSSLAPSPPPPLLPSPPDPLALPACVSSAMTYKWSSSWSTSLFSLKSASTAMSKGSFAKPNAFTHATASLVSAGPLGACWLPAPNACLPRTSSRFSSSSKHCSRMAIS
mmetsp:Transcript_66463/g.133920  ORF Transcript_66463/g.133920 Transcript_66463/m.133920 type:complete len:233 (-) Transcript_66463:1575-2273(-)